MMRRPRRKHSQQVHVDDARSAKRVRRSTAGLLAVAVVASVLADPRAARAFTTVGYSLVGANYGACTADATADPATLVAIGGPDREVAGNALTGLVASFAGIAGAKPVVVRASATARTFVVSPSSLSIPAGPGALSDELVRDIVMASSVIIVGGGISPGADSPAVVVRRGRAGVIAARTLAAVGRGRLPNGVVSREQAVARLDGIVVSSKVGLSSAEPYVAELLCAAFGQGGWGAVASVAEPEVRSISELRSRANGSADELKTPIVPADWVVASDDEIESSRLTAAIGKGSSFPLGPSADSRARSFSWRLPSSNYVWAAVARVRPPTDTGPCEGLLAAFGAMASTKLDQISRTVLIVETDGWPVGGVSCPPGEVRVARGTTRADVLVALASPTWTPPDPTVALPSTTVPTSVPATTPTSAASPAAKVTKKKVAKRTTAKRRK